jgi:hypothetical protein
VKLIGFDVLGFRSLADVRGITLGRPAILTGQNDGGKTSTIGALRFLLRGGTLANDDRTFVAGPDGESSQVEETTVTARLELSEAEMEQLGLPATIELRRTATNGASPSLEIKMTVPEDGRLRALSDKKITELKEIANALAAEPSGPRNQRESWLTPLRTLAESAPTVSEWVGTSRDVAHALPVLVEFASTTEPDPEADAARALRSAFDSAVKDEDRVGRLRDLEDEVTAELVAEASALAAHVRQRCPDLTDLEISPKVSFSEGFRGVTFRASADGGEAVTLGGAGAGRKRRITLAVWEWTTQLLDAGAFASGVVVAYDEPDTHLDYRHQRQLMDLIHDQCERPHVQMLVATHSMNLIDRVDISDVQHLALVDGRTSVTRLVDSSHEGIDRYLGDLASGLGLRNSVLLHERCFVAVEGPTESQSLPILFRSATGMSLQAAGIALVPCNGNEGALKVARFLQERDRRVAFLVDKDSTSNRETRKLFAVAKLQSYGFSEDQIHYVGDPTELEELFSDERWCTTANLHWPKGDGLQWDPQEIHALRGGPKFSTALLELFKVGSETGPSSKPEMMSTLAASSRGQGEVPDQLREIFRVLTELAQT